MANTQDDVSGYDLGSTGTILEIAVNGSDIAWNLSASGSADYSVDIRGANAGWFTIKTYSGVTSIDDGVVASEARRVRIENTSTNGGQTADAMLGADG